MKLHFLGAAGTVTGSKYLLESNGRRVLVDCGLFQGLKELRLRNWEAFPEAEKIAAVFLTHAHLDHSGYLPRLVKGGFQGPIFTSAATRELCRILLLDAAILMEEEALYANRHRYSKHSPALPLYTKEDAEKALSQFRVSERGEFAEFQYEFGRAGHILGASHVRLSAEGKSISFSGDVGRAGDPILLPPEPLRGADYFVVESTYGDRKHKEGELTELAALISKTIANHGSVLIPSFAVGRAQFLLYQMAELKRKLMIPDVPVYLDSPMATNVTQIYQERLGEHRLSREECQRLSQGVKFVRTQEESRHIAAISKPRIIISASGMLTGGRVLHHLKEMAGKKENLLLFPGYQAVGTRGARILAGEKAIKMLGEIVSVNCEIAYFESFSAHADSEEMVAWLRQSPKPKKCFVTHGEPLASKAMAEVFKDKLAYDCVMPKMGEVFSL